VFGSLAAEKQNIVITNRGWVIQRSRSSLSQFANLSKILGAGRTS
jgi:hypothetical protein